MKRKFFTLLAASVLTLSLGACANNGGAPAADDTVSKVFAKLANPLALDGSVSSTWTFGTGDEAQTMDNGSFDVKTVLTDNYFYAYTFRDYGWAIAESSDRYDKGRNGEALIYQLSPFTNEVETLVVMDRSGSLIPFDSMFTNPFKKSASGFSVVEGKLKLTDTSAIDPAFVFNIVFGGQQFSSPLKTFEIEYDKDYNPTKLHIEFEEATPYYSSNDVYEGNFVDLSAIDVDPIPEARPAQAGQDALQTIFDSLQDMNYTVEFECSVDMYDYDPETWEPIKIGTQDSTVKTYITPNGYFYEFGGTLAEYEAEVKTGQFADHGEIETPKGFVGFQRDSETGELNETRTPRPIRNTEQIFGDFWKYSARAFDVQEDGSFTLAKEKGFENYLRTSLMTDGIVYSPAFVENLVLKIVDGNLYYEYHDEQAVCKATIKNVGTTTLPVNTANINPYTPPTSWAEWSALSSWNERQMDVLNKMTDNHPEYIPYIYTPYDYEKSYSSDSDWYFDAETGEEWEVFRAVTNWRAVYQCDTCQEAVDCYNSAYKQLAAYDYFQYDPTQDAYFHNDGDPEGLNDFKLSIYIIKDYATQLSDEGVFKYAFVIDIVNTNYIR